MLFDASLNGAMNSSLNF